MTVHQPTDHGVQENDESGPKGSDEEEGLAATRQASGSKGTCVSNDVEHGQGRQAHGGIDLGATKMLEGVDGDLIRSLAIGEADDTHQTGQLSDGDVDGRSGHEGGNGGQGDELDDPPAANQTNEDDDGTSQDGDGRGHLIARNLGFFLLRLEHNIADDGGCHGHWLLDRGGHARRGQP